MGTHFLKRTRHNDMVLGHWSQPICAMHSQTSSGTLVANMHNWSSLQYLSKTEIFSLNSEHFDPSRSKLTFVAIETVPIIQWSLATVWNIIHLLFRVASPRRPDPNFEGPYL